MDHTPESFTVYIFDMNTKNIEIILEMAGARKKRAKDSHQNGRNAKKPKFVRPRKARNPKMSKDDPRLFNSEEANFNLTQWVGLEFFFRFFLDSIFNTSFRYTSLFRKLIKTVKYRLTCDEFVNTAWILD